MQSAFPFVVFGAVGISVVMSLVFLFTGRRSSGGGIYDEIGAGGISPDGDYPRGQLGPERAQAPDTPAVRAEREREVRQMLRARSERRVRRGEPALDVDAEVARLLDPQRQPPPAENPGLTEEVREEVRQLVVARNERRRRRGLEPLDVDTEVARTLEELNP
jgi:hypothetical protein